MKEALRRAIAIRDGINRKTGYADTSITDGVNHLLTDDRQIFIPQLQVIENPTDVDVIFDDDPFEDLEYLESTGSQYIDTGIKGANGLYIEFQFTSVANNEAGFGSLTNNNTNRYDIVYYEGLYFCCGTSSGSNPLALIENPLDFHVIEHGINNNNLIVDGTIVKSYPDFTNTVNYNHLLFARNNNGSIQKGKIKIKKCQIYINKVCVRDYIPRRNKWTKEIGMFDKINQNLNTGVGTFTPGPVISGGD